MICPSPKGGIASRQDSTNDFMYAPNALLRTIRSFMKVPNQPRVNYPRCFECEDEVNAASIGIKVICEECAAISGGRREGNLLIVELESEYDMEAEDPDSWNEAPYDPSN